MIVNIYTLKSTLWCLIEEGGWNKRGGGGVEKSLKHNKRVGWNSRRGVGNDATI